MPLLLLGATVLVPPPAAAAERSDDGSRQRISVRPRPTGSLLSGLVGPIDPHRFFEMLVDRYRRLLVYTDQVHVSQTISDRRGGEPRLVETDLVCRVDDGVLDVQTPTRQLGRVLGLLPEPRRAAPLSRATSGYDLWLVPHMALKFTDRPLEQFRTGVHEGFTASGAVPMTVDDKPMVQLQLKSGDGRCEECRAVFELLVNAESLLVERIESHERLPDGRSLRTTMDIVPIESDAALGEAAAPALRDNGGGPAAVDPLRPLLMPATPAP